MATEPSTAGGFRPDIEGLRAVAVLLVMVFHAGLPLRGGFLGVDVFFVLSGFLITGLLVRELGETGTVSWPRFLARRARRLLPAAILVLVVTAALGWFVIPGQRRVTLGADVVAAAVYVVNWAFAQRAVSYLASDDVPSAVQHFWSLAVEEQFYVVWPLLLIVGAVVGRRLLPRLHDRGGGPRLPLVGAPLALIAVPSLGWSVWLTHDNPSRAYFVSTTRAWELAVGAALAVWGIHRLESGRHLLPRRYAAPLAALGLLAIVGSAFWISEASPWPGWRAAVPTVGSAAVILAGWAAPKNPVSRRLGWRPLVAIGALSYSLYLWHWPALVLGQWALRDHGSVLLGSAFVAASVLPAWACHRFVEKPIHQGTGWASALGRSARPALALGLVLSITGVLAGLALQQARSPFVTTPASGVLPPLNTIGAATLPLGSSADAPAPVPGEWVTPDPLDASLDRPDADVDHCQVDVDAQDPVWCTFGDPQGMTTVALIGDSKAMQWLPALQQGALERRWRIVTAGKGSCLFSAGQAAVWGDPYPECDAWNDAVMAGLDRVRPDVIVTSANGGILLTEGENRRDALAGAFAERWSELGARGIPVLAIGNSPRSPDDLDVCAADHPRHLAACAFPKAPATVALGRQAMYLAAERVPTSSFVDFTDAICPGTTCPLVIGHVVVHRAGDHLTATYAATLGDRVIAEVNRVLDRES